MSVETHPSLATSAPLPLPHFRTTWNGKLLEAVRGIKHGFRSDSAFFVHLFTGSLILAAALVLQLSALEWTILVLALTIVLTAEFLSVALRTLLTGDGADPLPAQVCRAVRIASAGAVVAWLGGTLTVLLLFGARLVELFG